MSNGDAVTTITLTTTDTWKDKNGEKQQKTEWHRVIFYRKLAEIAGEYLKKGRPVYIEGRLETRKWTDKQGSEHYTTQIIADSMQMLGSKSGTSDQNDQPQTSARAGNANNGSGFDDMDDDIHF